MLDGINQFQIYSIHTKYVSLFKIHDYLSQAIAYIARVKVTVPVSLGFHLSHNLGFSKYGFCTL